MSCSDLGLENKRYISSNTPIFYTHAAVHASELVYAVLIYFILGNVSLVNDSNANPPIH